MESLYNHALDLDLDHAPALDHNPAPDLGFDFDLDQDLGPSLDLDQDQALDLDLDHDFARKNASLFSAALSIIISFL
jgi:hypothetical protein